jgi:signal transduction histidine kinase/CheY-like chemotaxis protein
MFSSERLIVTNNTKTSDIWAEHIGAYDSGVCALIDVPIRIGGKLVGAVCVEQDYTEAYPESREWNLEEQNFASSLADLMALAISGTERRAAWEAADHANRAKSEFLATMSHEIRTPMNSIMGFAELAEDTASNPQTRDCLTKIKDSTEWLLRIINDILDISKIEAGKMELEYVPFHLHDVFTRCQSVALPVVKEKELDLRVYTEALPGKKIIGDPVRLYQALMNLLSNAVKFTETGIVKFSSTVKHTENDGATVYFEVQDSGIGMTHAHTQKIFEPFIQADSSTTRSYGGTGLGLAITKNIVELMGGKLTVESAPGAGSTFSFEITFETLDVASGTDDRLENILIKRPYFDNFVLICDDNPMNQEVVCEHLARVGIRTAVADNGKIGVEMVKERMEKGEAPYDLIFMDMFMPVMDGIEAATRIIAAGSQTPIVAMTANVMVSEVENYKKHGMPDCLGKPFTSQDLWRVLLKHLEPISTEQANINEGHAELLKRLYVHFMKNNQSIFSDISAAIEAGETKLAHRLAHTLKGNAGLIGKTELQSAAVEIEELLKDGIAAFLENKMRQLKEELDRVFDELRPLVGKPGETIVTLMTHEQTVELFEKLEPMLERINPECVNLLDDIRAITGTEELARHIENYDFDAALVSLAEIKKRMV